MNVISLFLLLLGGGAAGFLAGFFGVGGGIIAVPLLLLYYQGIGVTSLVSTHLAFGTSLLVIVFSAGTSAYTHSRSNSVVWRIALLMGAGSIAGGIAGSLVAGSLAEAVLKRIFAVLVLVAAVAMFSERKKPKDQNPPPGLEQRAAATGIGVGAISSLAGVGGGILAVPVLYSSFHLPLKKAMGTSSATIAIAALASAVGYGVTGWGNPLLPAWTVGYVDPVAALPLIAGSIAMAHVGVNAADRMKAPALRRMFAALLLAMAIKMLVAP